MTLQDSFCHDQKGWAPLNSIAVATKYFGVTDLLRFFDKRYIYPLPRKMNIKSYNTVSYYTNYNFKGIRGALNPLGQVKHHLVNSDSEQTFFIEKNLGASLVAQWLRIRLPMQGTRGSSPGPGRSHMLRSN